MITYTSRQQARARRGLSSTVLIVSVATLAILIGAAVPASNRWRSVQERKVTQYQLQKLCDASARFFRDTRRAPISIAELITKPVDKSWSGPYLQCEATDPIEQLAEVQLDPWSRPYRFEAHGDEVDIGSAGEDGKFDEGEAFEARLDIARIRREETLSALRRINQAIALYNGQHQFTEPLSSEWSTALDQLVAARFLPCRNDFEIDGWGKPFVADPQGKAPLVRVASQSLDGKR
jgi:type II secretory pathway pseudopilin PulG